MCPTFIMLRGTVYKSTGKWYEVKANGVFYQATIKGKFKNQDIKSTNPVAVGDFVMIDLLPDEENVAIIVEILPRENYVIRQSPRHKHHLHVIAANIDQAVLVTSIANPTVKPGFIDRFLLMTEPFTIPVIICFNKMDTYSEDDWLYYEYLKVVYENIGYQVLATSATEAENIEELRSKIEGKTSLFSGQSGVGKSSLMNALDPSIARHVKMLSENTGKGQHTTTFAEMLDLNDQTKVIDTPGIKTLSFNYLEIQDVAHNFREFFILSKDCKFSNCTHRNEPHCAVKQALEDGAISELRYQNYLDIIIDIDAQNSWERLQ